MNGYSYTTPEQDSAKGGILYRIGNDAQKRRKELEKGLEDETARQQRMAKYAAWGEFLKAIGNLAGGAVAGGGAAPIAMQYDPSRTLQAFQSVDRLRAEQRNVDNDPMLSWLKNAELSRMTELEKQKQSAQNRMADIMNQSSIVRESTSDGRSTTTRGPVTQTSEGYTYDNAAMLAGTGKGSEKEPFTRLYRKADDQGHYTSIGIDRPKALMIARDVINAASEASSPDRKKTGYKSSIIDEDTARRIAGRFGNRLGNLVTTINGNDDEVSDNAIRQVLAEINHDDYITGRYYEWVQKEIPESDADGSSSGNAISGGLGWGKNDKAGENVENEEETDW